MFQRFRQSTSIGDVPAPNNDALRDMALTIAQGDGVDRKRSLFDLLDDACKFSAPKAMIESEFRQIWREVIAERKRRGADPEDVGKSERQLKSEYHAIAD